MERPDFKWFDRHGDAHRACQCVDSLSLRTFQYLLTKGLITGDLGACYNRIDEEDKVYLLLTIGSSFQSKPRYVRLPSEHLDLLHHLNVIPFPLTSRQHDLRPSDCDDVVLYDNFDRMPFIEMFIEASRDRSFSTWLVGDHALRGWMIHLMVSDDDLLGIEDLVFDRDDVLYGALAEDVQIYEYLLGRGVRFSKATTKYLAMGMTGVESDRLEHRDPIVESTPSLSIW